MKVYLVGHGEYSDRSISAIFSSLEKAKNYIAIEKKRQISYGWNDVDDEPSEFGLDKIACLEKVLFNAYQDNDKWICEISNKDYNKDTIKKYKKKPIQYFVLVNFNFDESVMKKAAMDKVMMLFAREEGI